MIMIVTLGAKWHLRKGPSAACSAGIDIHLNILIDICLEFIFKCSSKHI